MIRTVFERLFSRLRCRSFSVRFWDGTAAAYGDGPPEFEVIFHREPDLPAGGDLSLAMGEAYMRGDIDLSGDFAAMAAALDECAACGPGRGPGLAEHARNVLGKALNGLASAADLAQQKKNVQAHYDLGNDFFSLWLDRGMSYSCAYFKDAGDTLDAAQEQKNELVLRKLRLRPGMRLLDIGCGWGTLALRAAARHGAVVTAVTLSEEQCEAASRRARDLGLENRVTVRLQNYLGLDSAETYDRIVSVGMFEHVGRENIPRYFKTVAGLLRPGGLSLLHTLTKQKERGTDAWIRKYIFPGGYIPALREVMHALPEENLRPLHVESLRPHYARTLDLWWNAFSRPAVLEKIRAMFDEEFVRMWSLYLRMAGGYLRSGGLDVHQIVFSRGVNDTLPLTLGSVYCE